MGFLQHMWLFSGNGVLCMDIEQEGFTDITGIDYCQEAIDLAEKVRILLYKSL